MNDQNKPESEQPDQPDQPEAEGAAETEPTAGAAADEAGSAAPQPDVTAAPEAPDTGAVANDERQMAMLAHLLGGFLGFLVPLLIWALKKDESKFIEDQAREALNFQLTVLIGYLVSSALVFVFCLGVVTATVVWILSIVLGIIGGMQANKGIAYRYPFAIRLVKPTPVA